MRPFLNLAVMAFGLCQASVAENTRAKTFGSWVYKRYDWEHGQSAALSAAGVDWAWYAGGWSNAAGNVGAPGWTNQGLGELTVTLCFM